MNTANMKTTTHMLNIERHANPGIADRSNDVLRVCRQNRLSLLAPRHANARAYLRDLRAAEMAAWQLTGGDYLISLPSSFGGQTEPFNSLGNCFGSTG